MSAQGGLLEYHAESRTVSEIGKKSKTIKTKWSGLRVDISDDIFRRKPKTFLVHANGYGTIKTESRKIRVYNN